MHFKDQILDALAERVNVAQFVSFDPQLAQRYSRVTELPPNEVFASVRAAAQALLDRSAERSVNVRSFDPKDPKSRDFVYGLRSAEEADKVVRRLARNGLHTILNETIDIHDGGVSGVALGDVIEFAPDDTPRAVEKPGTAALSRELALRLLSTVYGFKPDLSFPKTTRVEFSLHPIRRGVRQEHQIIWELEDVGASHAVADVRWPNRFSQFIGDKAFGLLIAHLHGLPVPKTTVLCRRVAPFSFGVPTRTGEPWLRTSPRMQVPGKFTTQRGWSDPFELMSREDPTGSELASILFQEGIDATYSGAAIAAETPNGPSLTIEGTKGFGDEFMIGIKPRTSLPAQVCKAVEELYTRVFDQLGYVRFEWVANRRRIWIVQFHRGASPSAGRTIYPGNPHVYVSFHVTDGLEALRTVAQRASQLGEGVRLVGDVGITSHFGDVLRKARVPSVIAE